MNELNEQARGDIESGALVIAGLRITDPAVLGECRHWSQGRRGPAVELVALAETDLTAFAVNAVTIGSTAMAAAAGVQERYGIESLVAEVEKRSTQAANAAAERTEAAVTRASTALEKASEQTKRALVEAGQAARMALVQWVETARGDLTGQIGALFGGEEPQFLLRLQPLVDAFGRTLEESTLGQTSALIEKVSKQFDPADPASPMAQQMRALSETQARYAAEATEQQKGVGERLEALTAGLVASKATELALARTAAKGATYEEQTHALLAEIAAGLGDEYSETGNVVGLHPQQEG